MKAQPLDFTQIISFVEKGHTPENEFQHVLKYDLINKHGVRYNPHNELREFFYNAVYNPQHNDRNWVFAFMNYHLSKFKGDPREYTRYLEYQTQPKFVMAQFNERNQMRIDNVNVLLREWFNTSARSDKAMMVEGNFLIDESAVIRLFNEFKHYFSNEDLRTWKFRWQYGRRGLAPIQSDDKNIPLLILYKTYPRMNIKEQDEYALQNWGIKSFGSAKSRFVSGPLNFYKDLENKIKEILKDA